MTLSDSLTFPSGASMKNRFMLAPMTNTQSHEDGRLSDDEYHWLDDASQRTIRLGDDLRFARASHWKGLSWTARHLFR